LNEFVPDGAEGGCSATFDGLPIIAHAHAQIHTLEGGH